MILKRSFPLYYRILEFIHVNKKWIILCSCRLLDSSILCNLRSKNNTKTNHTKCKIEFLKVCSFTFNCICTFLELTTVVLYINVRLQFSSHYVIVYITLRKKCTRKWLPTYIWKRRLDIFNTNFGQCITSGLDATHSSNNLYLFYIRYMMRNKDLKVDLIV